jgi:uncharacterized membrane protein YhaH (DUF805 family)
MNKYFTTRLSRKKYILYGLLSNPLSVILFLGILTEVLFGGGSMFGLTIIDNIMEFIKSFGVGNFGLSTLLFSFFLVLPMVIFISCSIRRINDIGISRWFILFFLFYPFYINVMFFIFLLIKSGENKTNEWGDPV